MKDFEKLLPAWKVEVYDRKDEIDPSSEQDWYSLTLGWAIAKGLEPAKAYEFANWVRYNTRYG